jgi:hypothetical protein
MVLSDALVEEIFQTFVQMQSLILLQHKSIAGVVAKIQAEVLQHQQKQDETAKSIQLDSDIRRHPAKK